MFGAMGGFSGAVALLGYAICRLAPRAWEALQSPLSAGQWVFLVIFALFLLVAEGHRGFQKKFSPRTAARVKCLRENPRLSHVILAPFFCMRYFFAKRKARITALCLTFVMILPVVLVGFLPFPWRGLVDIGVALGLTCGVLSFAAFMIKAISDPVYQHSPEVPAE